MTKEKTISKVIEKVAEKVIDPLIPEVVKEKIKPKAKSKTKKDKVEQIKIKYFSEDLKRIEKIDIGDWIDLRSAEDMLIEPYTFKLIPLGIAMQLPKGYEAHVCPRSSTFKNFKIIQANSKGIIDNTYCGDNDQWYFPAHTLKSTGRVKMNDRICQFRIVPVQPKIEFKEVKILGNKDRGGFGSTGNK